MATFSSVCVLRFHAKLCKIGSTLFEINKCIAHVFAYLLPTVILTALAKPTAQFIGMQSITRCQRQDSISRSPVR